MKEIAEGVKGVIKVKDAKLRKAGPFLFGELEIAVDERITTKKAHEIGNEVEEKIKSTLTNLEHLIIHVEPIKREGIRRIAVPLENNKGEYSTISEHFGQAPYFAIVTLRDDKIEKLEIVENPNVKLSKKRGIETAKFLLGYNISDLITKNIGEGPYHTLKDNLVEIYDGKHCKTLQEALDLIKAEKLSLLKEPTE